MRIPACLILVAACTNHSSGPTPGNSGEHDARFVGLWAVTQPYHAAYEQTLYWFHSDGTIETGPSQPDDCTGHLSRHCVTGSVINCVPASGQDTCQSDRTCVFGSEWYSRGANRLVIVGECSDGVSRPIELTFNSDSSTNASGGANATLVSVGGDAGWSHDNWDWAFVKCPDGVEATCPASSPL
jgi:hypothetical protein